MEELPQCRRINWGGGGQEGPVSVLEKGRFPVHRVLEAVMG